MLPKIQKLLEISINSPVKIPAEDEATLLTFDNDGELTSYLATNPELAAKINLLLDQGNMATQLREDYADLQKIVGRALIMSQSGTAIPKISRTWQQSVQLTVGSNHVPIPHTGFSSGQIASRTATGFGLKVAEAADNATLLPNVDDIFEGTTTLLAKYPDLLTPVMLFTDVMADLKTPDEIITHFKQYLPTTDPRLPFVMNMGIKLAHSGLVPKGLLAWGIRTGVAVMAKRFIAGETLESAKPAIKKINKENLGFIGDVLGEAILTQDEAASYRNKYLSMLNDFLASAQQGNRSSGPLQNFKGKFRVPSFKTEHIPDHQIAIKLSGLVPASEWSSANPARTIKLVKDQLRPILKEMLKMELRHKIKVRLTIDPEEFEFRNLGVDILLSILEEPEFSNMTNLGIGVQAYLKDSKEVIRRIGNWSKEKSRSIPIRLVKGAYHDYESIQSSQKGFELPVFTEKAQTDKNYEECVELLYSYSPHLRAGIASHNLRTLSFAIELAKKTETPIEVQMLFGMANNVKKALADMGIPVYVYTPIGNLLEGMAYLARRLLENASQNGFLLQLAKLKSAFSVKLRNVLATLVGGDRQIEKEEDIRLILAEPHPEQSVASAIKEKKPDLGFLPTSLSQPFANEPLTDFSKRQNQDKIYAALSNLRLELEERTTAQNHFPIVVNGEELKSDHTFDVINPSNTAEKLGLVSYSSEDEIFAAVQTAQDKLTSWKQTTTEERAKILLRTAAILRKNKDRLTALMMLEASKPLKEADADVAEAVDFLEFYAREAIALEQGLTNFTFAPKGVAAVIAPWNFPLAILSGMTSASLVMGNTVLMKPSEQTPLIGYELYKAFKEAGLPDGVLNYLPGDGETGKNILSHKEIKLVTFTGSQKVGLKIYEEMMPRGVQVIAEMGGKNAMIVGIDAHIDDVIKAILASKFGFGGQKCSALDRLIIVGNQDRKNKIISRLIKAVDSLRVGHPEDFGVSYSAVIDAESKSRLEDIVARAKSDPAVRVHYSKSDGEVNGGHFVYPHIFEITDPNHALFQEEFFGPLLAVINVPTIQTAVSVAENVSGAITGAYEGRLPSDEEYVKANWKKVGNLYIKRAQTGATVDRHAFGADDLSGIRSSKAGGHDYLLQMTNLIPVNKDPLNLQRQSSLKETFMNILSKGQEQLLAEDVYQSALAGEDNKVVLSSRTESSDEKGLIFMDDKMGPDEIVALVALALGLKNNVQLFYNSPRKMMVASHLAEFSKEASLTNPDLGQLEIKEWPKSDSEMETLVAGLGVKWISSGDDFPVKHLQTVAKRQPGQNFVKINVEGSALAGDPRVPLALTRMRTLSVNTARHGHDAKRVKPLYHFQNQARTGLAKARAVTGGFWKSFTKTFAKK